MSCGGEGGRLRQCQYIVLERVSAYSGRQPRDASTSTSLHSGFQLDWRSQKKASLGRTPVWGHTLTPGHLDSTLMRKGGPFLLARALSCHGQRSMHLFVRSWELGWELVATGLDQIQRPVLSNHQGHGSNDRCLKNSKDLVVF